jgi:hypothetical protein
MAWLWRMLMVVTVTLVPGGFVLLLAYVTTRTMKERWVLAQAESRLRGVPVSIREVLHALEFKDLVRQARATL